MPESSFTNNCSYTINQLFLYQQENRVVDDTNGEPIPFATIYATPDETYGKH